MTKFADVGRILGRTELRLLKQNGVEGINPYLRRDRLTAEYLQDIAAEGMRVGVFFFETTGGQGQPPGDYHTFIQGQADCEASIALLAEFRAQGLIPPAGDQRVVVAYTDDIHLNPPELFDPYANGIEAALGPDIFHWDHQPGVYGWEDLIEWGREHYPHWHHFVQTYGRQTGELDVWQDEQTTIEGVTVDLDEEFIPGFVPGEEAKVDEHPIYQGETVAMVIVDPKSTDPEKRVARMSATWRYPDGSFHSREKKGVYTAGMKPYLIYPEVAPGADETEDLDAQPGVFIVVATEVK